MRKMTILLFCLLTMLMPLSAQQQTPPETQAVTISTEPPLSLHIPQGWDYAFDAPTRLYIDSEDLSILLELFPLEGDPYTAEMAASDGDIGPQSLLEFYFGDTLFSAPVEIDRPADSNEDAATVLRISSDFEDIYATFPLPDDFALFFVSGEQRADYQAEIEALVFSLGVATISPATEEPVIDQGDLTVQSAQGGGFTFSGLPENTVTMSTDWNEGTLSMQIPAEWEEGAFAFDGTLWVEPPDQNLFMVVTADLTFAFDLFGGVGDPQSFSSPESLLNAILEGSLGTGQFIEINRLGRYTIATYVDMEFGDLIMAIELEPGVLLVASAVGADDDDPGNLQNIIGPMLASLEYRR